MVDPLPLPARVPAVGRTQVSVLLVRADGSSLLRTGCLTPYAAETILDDVARAGAGTRRCVIRADDEAALTSLIERVAGLRERVRAHREGRDQVTVEFEPLQRAEEVGGSGGAM